MTRKPALGRGLKALLPDTPRARAGLAEIPLDRLRANPDQPRHHFDDRALAELAESLRNHGVLQPLLVAEDGDGGYRIIAGERRWRAARLAGLSAVPAVIRERVDGAADLELALVENLQRRDLTPLEEARAFDQLRANAGLSQAEIAARVGIDRSTVANALRLLKLPSDIQALVEGGQLTAGHARALLAFSAEEERRSWARRAVETGLSVRDLERAASASTTAPATSRATRPRPPAVDPNLKVAEERLALRLGTPVEIRPRRRGGSIIIRCADREQLIRVFDLLAGDD